MPGILCAKSPLPTKSDIWLCIPRAFVSLSYTVTGNNFARNTIFPLQGTMTKGSSCWIAATILSTTSYGVNMYIGNALLTPSNMPVLMK